MKLKERVLLVACFGCVVLLFYKFRASSNNSLSTIVDQLTEEHDLEQVGLDGFHQHRRRDANAKRENGVKLPDILSADEIKELESPFAENNVVNDISNDMHPWDIWWTMVTKRHVTSPDNPADVTKILNAMASMHILSADVGAKGTQLKSMLHLHGPTQQKVVFKPMRYPRDHIIKGKIYDGFDRHNAEIAAFHLDRILGFYRAPPVVGRRVNLDKDIKPVAKAKLLKTFFTNDKNDVCFYGVCYYCKKSEAACAEKNVMEGSVTIWLPDDRLLANNRHPWQRRYNNKKAKWQIDQNYCKGVMKVSPYDLAGPRMLDIIDTSMFDFLIGNGDRHHYETFKRWGSLGMVLHLDNGKSFGNPHEDEMSILSPVTQCCRVRDSTYSRLQKIARESSSPESLSSKLQESLKSDPLFPILTKPHLIALDRRLGILLDEIKKCIDVNGVKTVIIKDEF